MRLAQQTTSRLLAPLLLLPAVVRVHAHPYPKDELHDAGYSFVAPRECAHYCGLDNEFCCGANEPCYTVDGMETCGGGYALITQRALGVYTTTWTETHTYTSTVTTDWNPVIPVDTSVPCVPKNNDESQCGYLCCAWFQDCDHPGQCVNKPGYVDVGGGGGGGGGTVIYTSVYTTNGVAVTTGYSAPFRVHGSSTVAPGETQAAETSAEPTGTGGGGLSAGAIAGIVIGVLVGIGLLMLICFCCIVRGLWHAICGGKKKKKKDHRDEYYESEEYLGHGSSRHSRRDHHGSWYGEHSPKGKHDHHGKGWLGLAALAGTILALLNMRKKDKKKKEQRRTTRNSDAYYSSDPSGSSRSGSSGRGARSHYTRRTSRSRRSQPHSRR